MDEENVKILDPSLLPEKVREDLLKFLDDLECKAFDGKKDTDVHNLLAEAAMMQTKVLSEDDILQRSTDEVGEISNALDDNTDKDDFAYNLYPPFLRAQGESWFGHISEAILPADKKFFAVTITEIPGISEISPKLVSIIEDSWQEFLDKAFQRVNFVSKMFSAILQLVVFGNNPTQIDYNPEEGLMDLTVLNMKRFAVWPFKEDITRSNMVYRHHLFLPDLMGDPTIRGSILKDIIPELSLHTDYSTYFSQEVSEAKQSDRVPYDHVAAVNFFVPSFRTRWTTDSGTEKEFSLTNCLITVLRKEQLKTNNGKVPSAILKIIKFETRKDSPMTFSRFGTVMPNTPYYQSKIYQNTPFQAMANLMTSIALQAFMLSIFPMMKRKDYGDETEDDIEYTPRTVLSLKNMEDVEVLAFPFKLDDYITAMKYMYSLVQQSSAITETLEGTKSNPSERKTKFEAESLYNSGSVRINSVIKHLEGDFLHPNVSKYCSLTQFYLRHQKEVLDATVGEGIDETNKMELFIQKSKLYRNFLTLSRIKTKIRNLIKELTMSGNTVLMGEAQQLTAVLDENTLFKIITTPLSTSDITIQGNTAEINKSFQLQAIDSIIQHLTSLGAEQRTGKMININGILDQLKKLLGAPDMEFLVDPSQVVRNVAPSAPAPMAGGTQPEQPAEPAEA